MTRKSKKEIYDSISESGRNFNEEFIVGLWNEYHFRDRIVVRRYKRPNIGTGKMVKYDDRVVEEANPNYKEELEEYNKKIIGETAEEFYKKNTTLV